jgi:hypothetical protein
LTSLDVEDLASWRPLSEEFAVLIRLLVGPDGMAGEESFDLVVCSGEWLAAQARRDGIVDARHHLVVAGFDWPRIVTYLERRVAECEGDTWRQVASKLARLGYWEFEDYQA